MKPCFYLQIIGHLDGQTRLGQLDGESSIFNENALINLV